MCFIALWQNKDLEAIISILRMFIHHVRRLFALRCSAHCTRNAGPRTWNDSTTTHVLGQVRWDMIRFCRRRHLPVDERQFSSRSLRRVPHAQQRNGRPWQVERRDNQANRPLAALQSRHRTVTAPMLSQPSITRRLNLFSGLPKIYGMSAISAHFSARFCMQCLLFGDRGVARNLFWGRYKFLIM